MATNLDSVYFGSREALPHLLKTKGSIVNLSSASGLGGDWGLSAYNAAKGAVTNFGVGGLWPVELTGRQRTRYQRDRRKGAQRQGNGEDESRFSSKS